MPRAAPRIKRRSRAPAAGCRYPRSRAARCRLYFPEAAAGRGLYLWSFLQSRMYAQGVSCGDCHEAPSMKLRAAAMRCARNPQRGEYDSTAPPYAAPGSAARSARLPYARRTHAGGRAPRSFAAGAASDLSLQYGVPNACNSCHRDKDPRWAVPLRSKKAHGPQRQANQHFAGAWSPPAGVRRGPWSQLLALADDTTCPLSPAPPRCAALGRHPAEPPCPRCAARGEPDPLHASA